ncbi:MAG: mannosyltransferase family protein [Limisphaerales bacterium]
MKDSWRRVLRWVLLVKVVYLGAIYLALRLWPDMDVAKFYEVMMHWPRTGGPVFASHFATWDAAHYLYLSEAAYAPGVRSCAFYPLWPLFIRWGSLFTGGSDVITGMVLANGLSAAAWVLFHRVVAGRFSESAAHWALAWLIVFPGSLFYQFIYSEPVFLLLVMGLWLGLERRQYGVAWVSALLLPLARGVGVFCVLPIGWHLLMRRPVGAMRRWEWAKREQLRMESGAPNCGAGNSESAPTRLPYGLLLAPLLGWGIYFALMWGWTGNPFEGIEAQKYWGVHSIGNLWNVPKFVIGWFTPTAWHAFQGSMLDRLMFMFLIYTAPVVWRLGKDLVVWTYVLGILPAMSGTFTSYTRFAAVAFPVFVALAVFFEPRARRGWRWGLLAGLGALHLILLWRFVNFRWAG